MYICQLHVMHWKFVPPKINLKKESDQKWVEGKESDKKYIKKCYLHLPTFYKECKHCVLQMHANKNNCIDSRS